MTSPPPARSSLAQRLLALLLAATGALAASVPAAPAGTPPPAEGRVVVLGFDGADFATVQRMMEEGRMPNLKRLAEEGTFAPLGTTLNAESAVAWAALNTGQDPSHTGIPGFIKRDLLGDDFLPVEREGMPSAGLGYQRMEDRPVAEMDAGGLIGLVSRYDPLVVALGVAVLAFAAFLLAFKLLLRLRLFLALALAVVLSGIGGYATHRAAGYVPAVVPRVVANPLEVPTFWEVAAGAGVRSVVLDAAMSWDRQPVDGARVLAGLGLPDSRGGNGDWFIYSTDDLEIDRPPKGRSKGLTAGTVFRVDWRDDKIESQIFGPVNFAEADRVQRELAGISEQLADNTRGWQEGQRLRDEEERLEAELARLRDERVSVPLRVEKLGAERVSVTIGNHSQELGDEGWSDWYHLGFELNPLIKVHAVTRVRVLSMEPFSLFVNTLDTDPAKPPFWQPISQPAGFSAELERKTGAPFETFGWACATMPFKSKEITPEVMLEDIEFTMQWRERLAQQVLGEDDWRLMFAVFSTSDRVQHMMYKFYDPEHPLHDPEEARRRTEFFGESIELSEAIPAIYRQVDRIVGEVHDRLRPEDTLLICADHGFQSFRHQFHVNNWLAQNGYLALRSGVQMRDRRALAFVDWSKTRAYAVGLGVVYLNVRGRERDGIVDPADADALLREIARNLEAATDTRPGFVGQPVIDQAVLFKDQHDGPFLDREGDLMIGFAPNYRVSWATTLGDIKLRKDESGRAVPADVFEDNDNNWSGGHVSVAPKNVAGMFLSSKPLELPAEGVHLLHIAPTALGALGVELPQELARQALRAR